MTVLLCGHCGSPRHGGAPAYRCACIPAQVWQAPDLARAVHALDLSKVIQYLRRHPATRHHSQTALADMCGISQAMVSRLENGATATRIDNTVTALAGLGAPGVPGEIHQPHLDEDPPPPAGPRDDHGVPCVVLTSPAPIRVHVRDPDQDTPDPGGGVPGSVVLVVNPDDPCLVVDHGTAWGVTNTGNGATAWFALPTHWTQTPHPPR
ncbi:helix-turn-helix domain-containing protein [Nocardiopsis sp. LOL_012]|uniref:helix-turn-helix domain-containing protein n=1 Tax=Nocardiopsis sp. LOL_012 TaxID=3345409 RepID=UPI003A89EF94